MCERWSSFEAFLEDMGHPPFPGAQIDRKDNDGNYEPGNCRWSTRRDNINNRRSTMYLTLNGVTAPVTEWAERTGISAGVLRNRKYRGWSDERTLTEPIV